MRRATFFHRVFFASLALVSTASAWWGCSANAPETTTSTGGTGGSSSSTAGTAGSGGLGGFDGGGGLDDAGACTSTSEKAERIPLDMIFVIDQSGSMEGPNWDGTTAALKAFFNDPASNKIGAGLVFFPNHKEDYCVAEDYAGLDVPIDTLPANAFNLINAIPALPEEFGTPIYPALKGALMAATAYQDAHPTHKVVVVLATDGDPYGCPIQAIDYIAGLAKSARNYNGVQTYVIGIEGATLANLDQIAAAGGTEKTYDVTFDITEFAAKMEQIRNKALGCEFELPPPPNGQDLDPDKVNFTYTPEGSGDPKLLLRAKSFLDCGSDPGWYFDDNVSPTKILLCPASCVTVQADEKAEVNALFGCKSQLK